MQGFTIQEMCNYIIIIGTAYFMIVKIIDSFAKPTSRIKQKRKEKEECQMRRVLEEVIPKYLDEHDFKIRDDYLKEIKDEILRDTSSALDEIKDINNDQNNQLDHLDAMINALSQGSKDILRQKIMSIYNRHKQDKYLSFEEKENLDALYVDYKAINGNTYIDKKYARMLKWKVEDDDYIED